MTLSRLLLNAADAYWLDDVKARHKFDRRQQFMEESKAAMGVRGQPQENDLFDESKPRLDGSPDISAAARLDSGSTWEPNKPEVAEDEKSRGEYQIPRVNTGNFLDQYTPGQVAEYNTRLNGGVVPMTNFADNQRAIRQSGMANNAAMERYMINKPTGRQQDVQAAGFTPGTPEYYQFMKNVLQKPQSSVTVNSGKQESPVSISDLKNLVHKETGAHPQPGILPSQLHNGPYKVATTADQKNIDSKSKANSIVDQLDNMVDSIWVGDDTDSESGLERLKNIGTSNVQQLVQTDPRYKNYSDFTLGTVAQLVKSLGEVGALAEGDVERAMSLIPNLTGITDSRAVALEKMKKLKSLINPALGRRDLASDRQAKIAHIKQLRGGNK